MFNTVCISNSGYISNVYVQYLYLIDLVGHVRNLPRVTFCLAYIIIWSFVGITYRWFSSAKFTLCIKTASWGLVQHILPYLWRHRPDSMVYYMCDDNCNASACTALALLHALHFLNTLVGTDRAEIQCVHTL